jgi:hypothetical protein
MKRRFYSGGTPTQLTCRGAPCGYPKISAFTSLYVLVPDVSLRICRCGLIYLGLVRSGSVDSVGMEFPDRNSIDAHKIKIG